jgi:hypothetical protein
VVRPARRALQIRPKQRRDQPGRWLLLAQEKQAPAPCLPELVREGQASGVLEFDDPERLALLLFATVQGIAALANAGIVAPKRLDELVTDAIGRFLHGQRTAA